MSEQIPAGYYKGRAIAGSEQYGNKNGNEQIAIDIDVPTFNRKFTTFLFFTPDATPYAIERLRACGWTGDDVTDLRGIDANEIDVSIKYELYQGKEQMKVDIATGGGSVKLKETMNEQQKRAFAARMKQVIKSGGAVKPAKSATPNGSGHAAPQLPPQAGGDDSDIPF